MTTQVISYWLSVIALTSVLIWGLGLVSKELQKADTQGRTLLARAMSEKDGKESFSRVAGALGAVGLAATFVGIGYLIMFQLFNVQADLSKLDDLQVYFWAGSALFLPYAFNQLSSIFRARA